MLWTVSHLFVPWWSDEQRRTCSFSLSLSFVYLSSLVNMFSLMCVRSVFLYKFVFYFLHDSSWFWSTSICSLNWGTWPAPPPSRFVLNTPFPLPLPSLSLLLPPSLCCLFLSLFCSLLYLMMFNSHFSRILNWCKEMLEYLSCFLYFL